MRFERMTGWRGYCELAGDMPLQILTVTPGIAASSRHDTGLSLVKGDFVLFSAAERSAGKENCRVGYCCGGRVSRPLAIVFSDHAS